MVDYTKSKIYKIESITGEGLVYIGSTTRDYLSHVLSGHHEDYKNYKKGIRGNVRSFELFDEYGFENCRIVLIEEFKANNINELKQRVAHFISSMDCINKKTVIGRTSKQYHIDEHESIRAQQNKKYECTVCGSIISTGGKAIHERSKKHLKFVENVNTNNVLEV